MPAPSSGGQCRRHTHNTCTRTIQHSPHLLISWPLMSAMTSSLSGPADRKRWPSGSHAHEATDSRWWLWPSSTAAAHQESHVIELTEVCIKHTGHGVCTPAAAAATKQRQERGHPHSSQGRLLLSNLPAAGNTHCSLHPPTPAHPADQTCCRPCHAALCAVWFLTCASCKFSQHAPAMQL